MTLSPLLASRQALIWQACEQYFPVLRTGNQYRRHTSHRFGWVPCRRPSLPNTTTAEGNGAESLHPPNFVGAELEELVEEPLRA